MTHVRRFSFLLPFLFAAALYAQGTGTIDLSGPKQLMLTLVAGVFFAAALGCAVIAATSLVNFRGHDYHLGVIKLVMGLVGAIILGLAGTWVSGLTGQNITIPKI